MADNEKILVVEDEAGIARILQLELEHEGYGVGIATDGKMGYEMINTGEYHLVLLDVMLPLMSGIEVLRQVRQSGNKIPIILLTARDTVPDKVSGFEHGANDYITKPFAVEELLARVRNILRIFEQQNKEAEQADTIVLGDLTIELRSRKVTRKDNVIELTPREFELLVFLIENVNVEKSREDILSEVWGYDFIGETNLVDVYIRYLRQKLDKGYRYKLIHTVRGVGYMIKEPD